MEAAWLCNNLKGTGFCFTVVDCDWLSRVARIRVLDCASIIEPIYHAHVVELMSDRPKARDDEVGRLERLKTLPLLIVAMIMGKDVASWRSSRRLNWARKLPKRPRPELTTPGSPRKGLLRGGVCQ